MTEPKTHTLDVPGAVLHYDVRDGGDSDHPVLLMIGSPMGAEGFTTQAGHFTDRTVVTYDPRSSQRSQRTDGKLETNPDEHADDLHRLIDELGTGPVDIFASSGGAINALALVARHPGQVRVLVAHEPPACQELPDREAALATTTAIRELFYAQGFAPAMAKFIAVVSHEGPLPGDYATQPGPDPSLFGLPGGDDGNRNDPLLGHNIITCTHYQLDFDALAAASTRIVIGVGAASAQQLAGRAGAAVAARLGLEPVTFPGGHDGFLGGEYGGMGEPDGFAATLRKTLDS